MREVSHGDVGGDGPHSAPSMVSWLLKKLSAGLAASVRTVLSTSIESPVMAMSPSPVTTPTSVLGAPVGGDRNPLMGRLTVSLLVTRAKPRKTVKFRSGSAGFW